MKTNPPAKPRIAQRAGATAVEFAVVVPILLLLVWAGITFARANMIRHTVENAAYVASRAVIVPGATQEEAVQQAENLLRILGVKGATITFDPEIIEEDTLFVTTEISVPMESNSWGLNRFMRDAVFFGSSTLRTERTPAQQANGLPTVIAPPAPPQSAPTQLPSAPQMPTMPQMPSMPQLPPSSQPPSTSPPPSAPQPPAASPPPAAPQPPAASPPPAAPQPPAASPPPAAPPAPPQPPQKPPRKPRKL